MSSLSQVTRQLLIMRHGEAQESAASDFDRELTPAGWIAVARNARALVEKSLRPTLLFASPLTRARQTASIVATELDLKDVSIMDEITPYADPATIAASLQDIEGTPMLVTHQPLAGRLVEYLTGDEVRMGTAMIACSDGEVFEMSCAELLWLIG